MYTLNNYLKKTRGGNLAVIQFLRRNTYQLLMKVFAPGNVYLTRINDIPMYVYSNTVSFQDYVLQAYEPYTTEIFKQTIKPGAVVVDIGAQFGYFSLLAARQVGVEGRVFAFEPSISNFKLLSDNIRLNKYENITPFQKAVGEKLSTVTLFIYRDSDSHGMYQRPQTPVKESVEVECIALDQFLKVETVDCVKMDIEGHEPYALEGMKQTIARSKNMVLFAELVPGFLHEAGKKYEDYIAQLHSLGFHIQIIDEDQRCLRPLTTHIIRTEDEFWHANLYCTKRGL